MVSAKASGFAALRIRLVTPLLPLLLLGLGFSARAQTFTRDKRLLLQEGVLRGSPRVLGIAGAFVSVAEGAEGITRNPAAAASKDPHFEHDFNVDFGAAIHFLPPWGVKDQDWDNDGRLDQVDNAGQGGPVFNYLGTQVLYLAGSIQYKSIGLGLGVDVQSYVTKSMLPGQDFESYFNLDLVHAFGSLAGSFWDDQVLIGLGLESSSAGFIFLDPQPGLLPAVKDSLGYHGWGIQLGALWRPVDEDYRLGFSFRPQTTGEPTSQKDLIGGFIPFKEVVAPARLSLGASWALGSSGRHYNITSREGWSRLDEPNPDGSPAFSAALTRWLFTTQLDVFFPVSNATNASSFLEQNIGTPTLSAGTHLSFEPRAAIEKELIEDRFRLRLGGYLEPPLVATAPLVRPHITFGGEVYLFKLGPQRISFGLSFDMAHYYQNLSVAFLVWK